MSFYVAEVVVCIDESSFPYEGGPEIGERYRAMATDISIFEKMLEPAPAAPKKERVP